MLFQKNQKKISSILSNIYKPSLNEKDIDHLKDQIIQIIKKFNQNNSKKKLTISEKTSLVICYGDNVNSNQKSSIQVFQNFFKKHLKKYFNAIHFLPFYPSSSDSGFAVKDHYKIEKRIGSWSDIKKISKSSHVMADIVINHSSARGLWFKNFLKKKRPGKDYFLTVNSQFNTSKVVRPRDHKLLKKIDILILNHGIYNLSRENYNYENSIEINALSKFKFLNLFEDIALSNDSLIKKEIWINTSEAEILPALNPSYEISKSLIGKLVSFKKNLLTLSYPPK